MRRIARPFWAFLRSRQAGVELDREIAAHLQLLEDGFVAQGMSTADARGAARRAFGGQIEQTRLRHRDARSFRWLDEWWLDVTLGARMLVKYPGLSLVGGLGMAVAIAIARLGLEGAHGRSWRSDCWRLRCCSSSSRFCCCPQPASTA